LSRGSVREKRIATASFLNEGLAEVVKTPTVLRGHKQVYHHYTIRFPGPRDTLARSTSAE